MKKLRSLIGYTMSLATACTACLALSTTQLSADAYVSVEQCNDKNGVEVIDEEPCYFTSPEGDVWAFKKIYSLTEGLTLTPEVIANAYCTGVICQLYEGSTESLYVMNYEEMFYIDTDGTFTYDGETYQYELISPAFMSNGIRGTLMRALVHDADLAEYGIKNLDLNKDGKLSVHDAVIFNKRYMATPFNFVTNIDLLYLDRMEPDTFFDILSYYKETGQKEIRINYGDTLPSESVETAQDSITTEVEVTTKKSQTISRVISETAQKISAVTENLKSFFNGAH